MTHHILRFIGLSSIGLPIIQVAQRYFDTVEGTDPFSRHTAEQHKKHLFSGMHEPFFPTPEQREFLVAHFPECQDLLPISEEVFLQQQALKTSVKIQFITRCPAKLDYKNGGTVVVGGPPALVSCANERNVTHINDSRQDPIHKGSARHLEFDAQSEAPVNYLPTLFMAKQLFRAIFRYESLKNAEKTGQFSWRSLDWANWVKHPSHWLEGMRVAAEFQKIVKATSSPEARLTLEQENAARCKANEKFYEQLNKDLGNQLLYPERGSIIVARTPQEQQDLLNLQQGLEKEGRTLKLLSPEEMQQRYGFVPKNAIAFGEKAHDAVLSPNFVELIAARIQERGGKVIHGVLKTIYVNDPKDGGIAKYKTYDEKKHYIPFSKLVASLGKQRILDYRNESISDGVAARGVSVLAVAYVPKGRKLPPVTVCGGTNHVTKLSQPTTVQGKDGNFYDAYLLRMTAAACITPNVLEKGAANYDGVAATGLISSARQTFDCEIEIYDVHGCNRQVGPWGEGHTLYTPIAGKPISSIFTPRGKDLDLGTYTHQSKGAFFRQYYGGGGLTNAPTQPPLQEHHETNRS